MIHKNEEIQRLRSRIRNDQLKLYNLEDELFKTISKFENCTIQYEKLCGSLTKKNKPCKNLYNKCQYRRKGLHQ